MQIHELNNFTGTLGSGAYLAVDDGNDTGKVSTQQILANTEARIDNIIAGEAPSAEEIVDARLGADGVTYPSLGTAIRTQFTDVKSDLSDETSARILLAGRVTTAESNIDTLETHKVAQPLDEYNQPTDGTDGQSLRTKGDGTTEWADVGLPTDAQTAQAVSDWLDAHPEATTTVEDGSLTEAKFTNTLKLKTIKDYITPQMFGAKGDGIADDTQAIQDAIDSITYGTIFFPNGVYLISSPIQTTYGNSHSIQFELEKFAIIKASASMSSMVVIGGIVSNEPKPYNTYERGFLEKPCWNGGCIDGNGLADNGILFKNYTGYTFSNCSVYNCINKNVFVGHPDSVARAEFVAHDLNISSWGANECYGLYNCGFDSHFSDILIYGSKYALYEDGNMFCERIHACAIYAAYDGGYFARVHSDMSTFIDCYSDNYQTSYKVVNGGILHITNGLTYFYMSDSDISDACGGTYKNPIIFDFSDANGYAKLLIQGYRVTGAHQGIPFTHLLPKDTLLAATYMDSSNVIDYYSVMGMDDSDFIYSVMHEYTKYNARSFYELTGLNSKYIRLFRITSLSTNKDILVDFSITSGRTTSYYNSEVSIKIATTSPDSAEVKVLSASDSQYLPTFYICKSSITTSYGTSGIAYDVYMNVPTIGASVSTDAYINIKNIRIPYGFVSRLENESLVASLPSTALATSSQIKATEYIQISGGSSKTITKLSNSLLIFISRNGASISGAFMVDTWGGVTALGTPSNCSVSVSGTNITISNIGGSACSVSVAYFYA